MQNTKHGTFMWYLFCKVLKKVKRSPGWPPANNNPWLFWWFLLALRFQPQWLWYAACLAFPQRASCSPVSKATEKHMSLLNDVQFALCNKKITSKIDLAAGKRKEKLQAFGVEAQTTTQVAMCCYSCPWCAHKHPSPWLHPRFLCTSRRWMQKKKNVILLAPANL